MCASGPTLAGSLPTFTSPSLQVLYLAFNNFSGAVPENLGAHPTLRTLVSRNNFIASAVHPTPSSAMPLSFCLSCSFACLQDLENNTLTQLPTAWTSQPSANVTAPLRFLRQVLAGWHCLM